MSNFNEEIKYPENKEESYKLIHKQLEALLENETHLIPNLSNSSALLKLALPKPTGGILSPKNNELLLDPFKVNRPVSIFP